MHVCPFKRTKTEPGRRGEELEPGSSPFKSRKRNRSSKGELNHQAEETAKKAGLLNGNDGKYGRMRTYCLRKCLGEVWGRVPGNCF